MFLKSKAHQSLKETPLQDASISSAWSFHQATEDSCGNEGDLSLGSETCNYLAIPASKHMRASVPAVRRGSLRASLLAMKGQMFLPTVRRLIAISSHQAQHHKPFCLAMHSSFPSPSPHHIRCYLSALWPWL